MVWWLWYCIYKLMNWDRYLIIESLLHEVCSRVRTHCRPVLLGYFYAKEWYCSYHSLNTLTLTACWDSAETRKQNKCLIRTKNVDIISKKLNWKWVIGYRFVLLKAGLINTNNQNNINDDFKKMITISSKTESERRLSLSLRVICYAVASNWIGCLFTSWFIFRRHKFIFDFSIKFDEVLFFTDNSTSGKHLHIKTQFCFSCQTCLEMIRMW